MDYYRYEGHLNPVPPYEFEHSRRYSRQRHMGAMQTDIGHTLIFPITFVDQCLIVTLRSRGKVESPLLMTTVTSPTELAEPQLEQIHVQIRFFLSLDEDIQPLYSLGWDDDPFADIVDAWYGYHQVKFVTPFAAACFALFGQACGLETGTTLWHTILTGLGPELTFTDKLWHSFPSASTIALQKQAALSKLVGDEVLTGRLQQLAQAFIAREKQPSLAIQEYDTEQLFAWLTNHTTLDNKAIQFVLIRGFGCCDQFMMPLEEILSLAKKVYGAEMQLKQLQEQANHYKSWQGYWYHYLSLNELT